MIEQISGLDNDFESEVEEQKQEENLEAENKIQISEHLSRENHQESYESGSFEEQKQR